MRQPSIGIDLARLLVVEKSKIETEGRDVYGLLIYVNARDLFAQNPSKLRTTDLLTTLLRVKMAHHPPKGFHQEDAGAASGIDDARAGRKNLGGQRLGEDKLNERGCCVVGPLVAVVAVRSL